MERVLRAIADSEQQMIEYLQRLVSIDSGCDNPEGIAQVSRLVGKKLDEIGFKVEYLDYPGICTHLKATKKGSTSRKVIVMGHMDTIFPKGTAQKRPFTIKDGKAYGPGVLDMKGGITIALFTLQALADAGKTEKEITVMFAGDEEIAHPKTNAAELYEKEAHGKDATFNMETASAGEAVYIGRKGNLYAEMAVKGIAAHPSVDPEKDANAITELAYKVIEISKLTDFDQGFIYTPGVIAGGRIANVVPDHALLKIDVRYLKNDDRYKAEKALQEIASRQYVRGTTTELINLWEKYAPMEACDMNKKLFEIVRAQGKKLGIDIEAKIGGSASDSCWTVKAGAPSICAMGAIGRFNHSDSEFIYLDSLVKRAKLLALSINAV